MIPVRWNPIKLKRAAHAQEGKELEAERGLVEAYLMRAATSVSEGRRHVVHCFGVVHKPRQTFPNPIDDEEPEVIVSPEYWLVLELTLDGSLHDALHGPAADAGWVQQREEGWLTGLAAALAFVHSVLHVTHCDVKPSNCLLFNDARYTCLRDRDERQQEALTVWPGLGQAPQARRLRLCLPGQQHSRDLPRRHHAWCGVHGALRFPRAAHAAASFAQG
eukprot:3934271-Rhodomonas_salina.2